MTDAAVKHPAKFHDSIIEKAKGWVVMEMGRQGRPLKIFDPFAGTGKFHVLNRLEYDGVRCQTFGTELEPEWAQQASDHGGLTRTLDILSPRGRKFMRDTRPDVVFTSPSYGNRMTDHHNAQDGSVRYSYTHTLGRTLSVGNSGVMVWGKDYRKFHEEAINLTVDAMEPGGLILWNIADHVRHGVRERVASWHMAVLCQRCAIMCVERIETPKLMHGRNGTRRAEGELLLCMRTPGGREWL